MHVIFVIKSENNSFYVVEFGFSRMSAQIYYLLIKLQIRLKELKNESVDRVKIPMVF
jgi:hypothetical protein